MNDQTLTILLLMWVLSGVATLLLLWAISADYIKKLRKRVPNRRCPKCWYNLTHTPSLTCSECGYTDKHEKKLHKTKIPKRLIFLASYSLHLYPSVKARGWTAAIPTTILITLLPDAESPSELSWKGDRRVRNPFALEMSARVCADEVADWQMKWAIKHCRVIRTRKNGLLTNHFV